MLGNYGRKVFQIDRKVDFCLKIELESFILYDLKVVQERQRYYMHSTIEV